MSYFTMLRLLFVSVIFLGIHLPGYNQSRIVTLDSGEKVILHADKTWEYFEEVSYDFDFSSLRDDVIPDFLRKGISVDKHTLIIAVEMHFQGWQYTMPKPKSSQAYWGNQDGRTTWWNGYWYNSKTRKYSDKTPTKESNEKYYGDAQKKKGYWRNGGSPRRPTKLEWLLSKSGGVKPYN